MTRAATAPAKPTTGLWQIDPAHSNVEFAVKHMMISTVRGRFPGLSGTIALNEADLAKSAVEVSIDVAGIDTREPQRDGHLKSADFFNAEQFPTIRFKSRSIELVKPERFLLVGDLEIRGVGREVALEATHEGQAKDPWGNQRIAFSATGKIDRRDFGLTWNQVLETGGLLVGNEVKILIEVEAIRTDN